MYGPGGKIVAWLVPCNEHAVVFSYMSQEPLRQAIAAIKQGKPDLAGDAEVAKVAALLPSGAAWSMYVSPKGIFDFLNQTMAAALPPGSGVKIPEFRPDTPDGDGRDQRSRRSGGSTDRSGRGRQGDRPSCRGETRQYPADNVRETYER